MFTNLKEQEFFLKHLTKEDNVLEYGSGESTLQISKLVKTIVSVEHQQQWHEKIAKTAPENCKLILSKPDLPYIEGNEDGTFDEFKTYVFSPIDYAPFNIILIDGRARVSCSSICNRLGNKDTLVFIHDFHRPEYEEALKYLELLEKCDTMIKCKIRF
jgi:hypothetical protein